jgi:hypothetical protein
MNNLNTWQTINPTPDEIHAAYVAFEDLPTMDFLPRLVMVRRAVAAGFYTDNLPVRSPKQTGRRPGQTTARSRAVSKVPRPGRTSTSIGGGADTEGVF